MPRTPKNYNKSVFINCPFDARYQPMFHAAIFTIMDCGFTPRCALEISDSGDLRMEKINRLIESCRFGLHDLSRIQARPFPRFNMPLELGLFLGAKRFGPRLQKGKHCAIFDEKPFRYQQFISDISGYDILDHDGDYRKLIARIRDWLVTHNCGRHLPGGSAIVARYEKFRKHLPAMCRELEVRKSELTFTDFVILIKQASQRL